MPTYRLETREPLPTGRKAIGAWGEARVVDWCLERGMKLLGRHVILPGSELDLVIREGDRIAFGEVRVRSSHRGVSAVESVGFAKQESWRTGAEHWVGTQGPFPEAWHFHFDLFVIEPTLPPGGWELTIFPDALQ